MKSFKILFSSLNITQRIPFHFPSDNMYEIQQNLITTGTDIMDKM
jgi:hypothetical protein